MSKGFPELDGARLSVDEETRRRHLAAIEAALRRRARVARRRRVLALAAAAILTIPAMALASDASLPGDVLYPVKRAVEPIVGLFDRDVAAEHRVEEVEEMLERDVPHDVIRRHVDVARDAVTDRFPHLEERLNRVVSDLAEKEGAIDRTAPFEDVTDRPRRDPATDITDITDITDVTDVTDVTDTTTDRLVDQPATTTTTHPPTDVTRPRGGDG